MKLQEIAAVSGKPGLFVIKSPTRSGVILESLDDKQSRMAASTNHRISVLSEISIYTTTTEGSVALEEIFQKIHKEFGDDPGVNAKSDPEEIKAFLQHILPDYDRDRVYVSDMKKLLAWYHILLERAPEALQPQEEEAEAKEKDAGKEKKEKAAKKDA